jgi:hypothetical protein
VKINNQSIEPAEGAHPHTRPSNAELLFIVNQDILFNTFCLFSSFAIEIIFKIIYLINEIYYFE